MHARPCANGAQRCHRLILHCQPQMNSARACTVHQGNYRVENRIARPFPHACTRWEATPTQPAG
eukprot:10651589-Lingulodinium_polyedra.AAC.1